MRTKPTFQVLHSGGSGIEEAFEALPQIKHPLSLFVPIANR